MASNKEQNENARQPDQSPRTSRRNLLKSAGIMGAAALGTGAAGQVIAQDGGADAGPIAREALEALTAAEAEFLEHACDCLIPSDDNGPGAKEARAVHYIDRSLAAHNAADRHAYLVSIAAIDDFARRSRGKPFSQLIRDQQESILRAVQNDEVPGCAPSGSGFFSMLRSHTIDGTFCDPYYGGNQDFVGWDLIRYPGIRLSASETDVASGSSLAPNHQSAYDNDTYTKMARNMNLAGRGGSDNA